MKAFLITFFLLSNGAWGGEPQLGVDVSDVVKHPLIMSLKRDELIFEQTVDPLPDDGWLSFQAFDQLQVIAEDFQVQETTDISRVIAYGGYQAGRTMSMEYAMLEIFSDAQGLPGQSIYNEMFQNPDSGMSGMLELAPSDLTLQPGRYWVSVYEYSDNSASSFPKWFWFFFEPSSFGSPAAFTLDGESWFEAQNSNELGIGTTSMVFQVYGGSDPVSETPTISFPNFLSATNFYNDANDNLFCQFPDPNSDGAYGGSGRLAWEVRFTENCELLGSALIDQASYPFGISVPHPSEGLYFIECRRVVVGGKRDETSPPYVQPGPNASNPSNEINPRYVLHVPKIGGGFKGVLRIANPNPVDNAAMLLLAYNAAGQEVSSVAISVPAGGNRSYGIYEAPANVSVNATYFSGFRDQLAFVEAREIKSDLTEVLFSYYSLASGVGADVAAAKASQGESVGLEFTMQSGNPSSDYWDGVAILNLDDATANVWVMQKDSGGNLLGERLLGNIAPDQKLLSVVSELFPFVPYSQFTIESRNGVYIQVLGLNGSFDNAVFKDSKVSKKR